MDGFTLGGAATGGMGMSNPFSSIMPMPGGAPAMGGLNWEKLMQLAGPSLVSKGVDKLFGGQDNSAAILQALQQGGGGRALGSAGGGSPITAPGSTMAQLAQRRSPMMNSMSMF